MLNRVFSRLRPSPGTAISLLALVIALGGAGYAATGGNFILGVNSNSATSQTGLISNFGGRALAVQNMSTAAGASALSLVVGAGRPPFITNSNTKVPNLNSDWLDGLNSTAFARIGSVNAQTLDGLDSSVFAPRADDDDWHFIGDPGEPAFQNGWSNYDTSASHRDATWQHASYRKDNFGVVHIRGLVKGGTVGQPMFTLSFTYCPWYFHAFGVISNNAFARLTVQFVQPGCPVYVENGTNDWVSLEGVSYQEWPREDPGAAVATASPRTSHIGPGSTRVVRNTGITP